MDMTPKELSRGTRAKICFVTMEYPPDWGGISKSAKRIVDLLRMAGFEMHVFAPERNADITVLKMEQVDGVHLYRVPISRDFNEDHEGGVVPFVWAIYQADLLHNFDLFHGFCLPMAYPCLALPDRGERPVIASIRGNDGTDMLEGGQFKGIVRTVLKSASWVTSVSTDSLVRAQLVADISCRSSFIGNSIAPYEGQRWRASEYNRGVVGTVCTFRPKKNVPGLIEAYSKVDPHVRRRLLLVGDCFASDNVSRLNINNALIKHEVEGETEETGYVENTSIADWLLKMNVFVLSSLQEGFPNTLLEAASVGLPIVATAVDGVKDVYRDIPDALLVEPDNPAELAKAIESVLRDEALASRLSSQSLSVAAQYSHAREQAAYVELYERLLSCNSLAKVV